MRTLEETAIEEMTRSLGEIKGFCQSIYLGIESVLKELDSLKGERRISSDRICDRLDKILIGVSNLSMGLKEITAPGILAGYKVKHPEIIDTTPLPLYEELTSAAQEIQGDIAQRCAKFGKKMLEMTNGRDSTQFLADCVNLLKDMHREIEARRNRVEALRNRRKNIDKGSNEQKNAAILIVKVKSMIEPLEKFSEFVLNSYFAKRRRMLSEIWRTTSAIEEMYDDKSVEFKERVPAASEAHKISSALKELSSITNRHTETHRVNMLVKSGNMSALERRKVLAGLKTP